MSKESHLSIIDALEKASTEQLQAMARIEAAIVGNRLVPKPEEKTADNEIVQPVRTSQRKGKRKSQHKEPAPGIEPQPQTTQYPAVRGEIPLQDVAEAMKKIAEPLEAKRRKNSAMPAPRIVSSSAIGQQAITTGTPISFAANERTAKLKAVSGADREETMVRAISSTMSGAKGTSADSLIKPISSLEKAIAANTATVLKSTKKGGPKRGANGRFESKNKAEEVRQDQKKKRDDKNAKEAEGKQEEGFLYRLKNAIGERPAADENQSADMAGTAAGGVAWHMARGAWDVGSTVYGNAKSMNEWRKEHFGKKSPADPDSDEEETEVRGNLALKPQPKPPLALPAVPVQGASANQSAGIFHEGAAQEEVKATQEQTKTITKDGTAILKNQADELDLLKKIAENTANDSSKGIGGNLFDKLFRRNGGRGKRGKRGKSFRERFSRKNKAASEREPEKAPAEKGKGSTKATEQKKTAKTAEPPAGKDNSAPKLTETAKNTPDTAKNGGLLKRTPEKAITAEHAANEAILDTAKKPALSEAAKVGAKSAVKLGIKAIPLIGTAAGMAWDAADGYNDTDGQREAFHLKDGQQATPRQKSEMSAANVAGMGGLVPLVSDGLSWGANKLGITNDPDALSVSTPTIARGIDSGVSAISETAKSVTRWFTKDDTANSQITNAIKAGSADTVSAIDRLNRQLQGGKLGEDGIGQSGASRGDYIAPTKDAIVSGPNGLNIGGVHAANRNFRNNNFGNLNFANQEGAVLEDAPEKGKARFARFATPEDGFRALADQITRYSDGTSKAAGYQKINTVQGIISKWAPSTENDTGKYIQTISDNMGVKPGDTINTSDPEVMTKLIRSIATYEGGNPQVTDAYIKQSIGHKDESAHKWVGGSYSQESADYMAKNGIKGSADALPVAAATTISKISNGENNNPDVDSKKSQTGYIHNEIKNNPKVDNLKSNSESNNIHNGTEIPSGIKNNPKVDISTSTANPEIQKEQLKIPNGIKSGSNVIPQNSALPAITTPANTQAITSAHPAWLTSLAQHAENSDSSITDFVNRTTGASIGFRRPTSELTLPKNATESDVPAGLRPAFLAELKHRTEDIQKTWAPVTVASHKSDERAAPSTPAAAPIAPAPIAPEQIPVAHNAPVGSAANPISAPATKHGKESVADPVTTQRQVPRQPGQVLHSTAPSVVSHSAGIPAATGSIGLFPAGAVVPANMVNRAYPVSRDAPPPAAQQKKGSQGLMSSIGSFFSDSWDDIKTATPQVLGAVGHAALPMAQDALSSAVGGLGSKALSGISSPVLNSLASPFINQGVGMAKGIIRQPQNATSMLSMPSVLPTVTNLAKSGVIDAAGRAAKNTPGDSGKLLQQLVSLTKQLVDGQKKDTKDGKPDVVVNGGQKAPKHDDKYSDSALESLLED